MSSTAVEQRVDGRSEARFGELLRSWRQRRRLSQLDLSLEAGVSTRHVSFLETGRSQPSREMVLMLADQLAVPLRERNELLLAAGFAPAYGRRLFDAPELAAVRRAVEQVLAAHHPFPALAVDRQWDVVATNGAAAMLLGSLPPAMAGPPLNVYRVTLHPEGISGRVANIVEIARYLVHRLRADVAATGDPALEALLDEVVSYPVVAAAERSAPTGPDASDVVVPLRMRHPDGELAMFSTITTFGTPADVTVAELAIELFYPMDERTGERLREMASGLPTA